MVRRLAAGAACVRGTACVALGSRLRLDEQQRSRSEVDWPIMVVLSCF